MFGDLFLSSIYYLLIVLMDATFVATTSQKCPKSWLHDEPGRVCYHVARDKMSLRDAQTYCQRRHNATLLRIECGGETEFIVSRVRSRGDFWIDARARFDILDGAAGLFAPGYVYRWPNGRLVRYTNWSRDNATTQRDDDKCVQVRADDGKWRKSRCDKSARANVVCEKRLINRRVSSCPAKHWVYWPATQSCYRAVASPNLTALAADSRCYSHGAEHRHDAMLSSVGSDEENAFVLALARAKNAHFDFIFLGGFGKSNNGQKWHWMDGSPFSYQNWDRGSPYGARAYAILVMNRRGKWINHYADRILSQFNAVAVCKFKS